MEVLLLSDAIQRVTTIRQLQELVNAGQVKSRLLELSGGHLNGYYTGFSETIVKQFMEYITTHPYDRNLKLEFIDVINVLSPESVSKEWDNKFTEFLAEAYLNGDVTMDWVVNLINNGGEYHSDFFVQVMNDDNEQEVYDGLMEVIGELVVCDNIISKVGSKDILKQYTKSRGIGYIAHLLIPALINSMGRFRLVLNVLLDDGYSCKEILINHLSNRPVVERETYGDIIGILASDCGINLVELRDELPLGSNERDALEEIINIGDV